MFKRTVTMMLAAGTLVLGGCASNGGTEQAGADNSDFGGKSIYLRGEMNDWMATDESKVVKVADKLYMAKGTLKKEWAPYKFKFADSGWSCGTNFGYKCSGQLNPDTWLGRVSAFAGGIPSLC